MLSGRPGRLDANGSGRPAAGPVSGIRRMSYLAVCATSRNDSSGARATPFREDQPVRDEVELGAGRVVAEDAAVGPVLEQVPLVVFDAKPGRAVGEVDSAVGGH